jgi:nucleoside-triphosphatase THEP1
VPDPVSAFSPTLWSSATFCARRVPADGVAAAKRRRRLGIAPRVCIMTKGSSTIHAIVYDEGSPTSAFARSLVAFWTHAGLRVAGLVEDDMPRPDRGVCDMVLHELVSGERILISKYRGKQARGCRLDTGALLQAAELVRCSLAEADILILNKFGKIESEGGGLRSLIVDALDHAVPIVIFVPRRNQDSWQDFVSPLATQWDFADLSDGATASEMFGLHLRSRQPADTGAT